MRPKASLDTTDMFLERRSRDHKGHEDGDLQADTAPPTAQASTLQELRQQLQETQERLQGLAAASNQIVWTARPDGTAHDSPLWRAYTGQSINDVQGLGWMNAIHPADRERTRMVWLRAVAAKTTYEVEYRLRRADGLYRPFLVRGVPLLDAGGNVREWVGVCIDISERKELEESRRASEAHFRATFEHASVGIGNATFDGRWFDVNQQLCDMLGYTREEMLTLRFQDVTHPDDLAISMEHHRQLWEGECQSYEFDKRYIRKDGTLIWVHLTISLMRTAEGQPLHSIAIIEDITRRKQIEEEKIRLLSREQQARAEAAARASQLEVTLEAMTEGVGIYDLQGYSLLTNQAGRKILGIDTDPDLRASFTARSHPERIALLKTRDKNGQPFPPERSPLTRALQGEIVGDARSEDMIITALDGRERHLSATAAPISDAQGRLNGAVFVYRDVTERRRLERQTQDALNALLEMAEMLVAPATMEECGSAKEALIEINVLALRMAEMAARVLGCEHVGIATVEPETTRFRPLALVSPDPEKQQRWWNQHIQRPCMKDVFDTEQIERLQAGEAMLIDMRKSPCGDFPHPFDIPRILFAAMCVGKQVIGLLSVGRSNAEHIYTPQEIALAGAVAKLMGLVIEREHLLRQREEAYASAFALREANRQMDTFLGIASHELNTPLTALKLHHQMIQRRLQQWENQAIPAEELPGFLATLNQQHVRAQAQIMRLSRLVSELLDASRIQVGHLQLHLQPTNLVALVRDSVEEQRQASPDRSIRLLLSEKPEVIVSADADRLSQVVTNYLTNALKYSSETHPVEIGITSEADQARVWVHDQGPGLTPAQQAHLWERFQRVPGIEVRSGSGIGLGLGLYICKNIIEEHHGQVGVQSAPGEGSTFWFTVPLASSPR